MKIQDIIFFIVTILLIAIRKPRLFILGGLISLILAIPLFVTWTFFTAERLVWYAWALFALSFIFLKPKK